MPNFIDIKNRLYVQEKQKNSEWSGQFGEDVAEEWLKGGNWEIINVNKEDVFTNELYDAGGKKPDFIGRVDDIDAVILWDAKFHTTLGNKFKIKKSELAKYNNLDSYAKRKINENIHIIFIVIPKESDGEKMYLVHLSQFNNEGSGAIIDDCTAIEIALKEIDCYETKVYQRKILEQYREQI